MIQDMPLHYVYSTTTKKIIIDECFHDIAPMRIIHMSIICGQRGIACHFDKTIWTERFRKSEEFMNLITDPKKYDKISTYIDYIAFELAIANHAAMFDMAIDLGAVLTVPTK